MQRLTTLKFENAILLCCWGAGWGPSQSISKKQIVFFFFCRMSYEVLNHKLVNSYHFNGDGHASVCLHLTASLFWPLNFNWHFLVLSTTTTAQIRNKLKSNWTEVVIRWPDDKHNSGKGTIEFRVVAWKKSNHHSSPDSRAILLSFKVLGLTLQVESGRTPTVRRR